MELGLINLVISFFLAIAVAPLIIRWLKKLKFGQEILVYVEQHKSKSGTPTMGGVIILIAGVIGYLIFYRENNILATISILTMLSFGILGFLDDFIKIKLKHNEGLKPYQKVIGQLGISIIIAVYIYMSDLVGSEVVVPFTNYTFNLGWGIIPFVVFFFVAVVNSVNLIDGLDGLCGGVSSVFIFVFAIILSLLSSSLTGVYFEEVNNIIIVLFGVAGSVLGFLCYNGYPAKVFMGDTGSLALGGLIATTTALTRQYFLVCVIGVLYVLTALSVIIQVVVFKITKGKRVFKMSPLHHHFEVTSHEAKVTLIYVMITLIIGVLTIVAYL